MELRNLPPQGTVALLIITVFITVSMTLAINRYGPTILKWLGWPFRKSSEFIYHWIAPRNPLSIALRSYRKLVRRSALARIENPVGPGIEVPLEHAFAPLRLISSAEKEATDLFSYAAAKARFIVLGGPGTGKTTLMKNLILSIIERRSHDELNDLIPVFVV
jgi:hypothetical protein